VLRGSKAGLYHRQATLPQGLQGACLRVKRTAQGRTEPMLRAGPAQAGKRRALGQDLEALSECELWHQALRHLQAARRKTGAACAPRALAAV